MSSNMKYGITGGLALGVALFLSVITMPEQEDYTQPQMGGGFLWWVIRTVIIFVVMYLATKEMRQQSGGLIKMGKAFGNAYGVGLIMLLTYTLASMLCYYVFIPDWFPVDFDQWMEMAGQSSGGDEQAEAVMKWIYENLTGLVIFGGLFINLIGYLVPALVASLILAKEDTTEINL